MTFLSFTYIQCVDMLLVGVWRKISCLPNHHPLLNKLSLLRIQLLLMLSHLLELLDVLIHLVPLRLVLIVRHLLICLKLLLLLLVRMVDITLSSHSILDRVVRHVLILLLRYLIAIVLLSVVTGQVCW